MNKIETLYKKLSPDEILVGIDELIKDRQSLISDDEEANKVFLKDINLLKNIKENLYGLAKESIDYQSKYEQLEQQRQKVIEHIKKHISFRCGMNLADIAFLLEMLGEEDGN